MASPRALKIGMTCYPSVGGSGILATALGEELARRGHEVHFISYERPFRLPLYSPRLFFHPVVINDYGLFKYPDYTLPLSVKMAEVSRDHGLDVLHVHYAVPHATAAILARSMLPAAQRPRVVTTLHGTDTTLLGRDAGYGPAITHALHSSDAITTVSEFLKRETERLLSVEKPIDVIHNFFAPRPPKRSRAEVRRELGMREVTPAEQLGSPIGSGHDGSLGSMPPAPLGPMRDGALIFHSSNLRPVKRIDLLLATIALLRPRDAFKLVILAGEDFSPFQAELQRLGLQDQVIVCQKVNEIEDYLGAADIGLFTSESESFCLGILEGMFFGCPSVATRVGGIPEVVEHGVSGLLAPSGDVVALAEAVQALIDDPKRRAQLGRSAQERARQMFSADAIVPHYEALYHRVCS